MIYATADDIRRLDQAASRDYSIPGILLMENAGKAVADVIRREYKPCRVLVIAGKGNNGGDGLVVARYLAGHGYRVKIALLEDPAHLKADPLANFTLTQKNNIPCAAISKSVSEEALLELCRESELIVDAIFGIGIHSPACGIFEKAISAINRSKKPVVSIDIPSGLDSDTGQVHGVAVKATRTVTLALPKFGLYKGEGPHHSGEIEVADIGIPRELLVSFMNDSCL
jgi:NAD(P)H-hydrate epimerase